MFQRFGERGRAAIGSAQNEAFLLGHDWLGSEHLLLALLADKGVAGSVLRGRGLTPAQILGEYRGVAGSCSAPATARPDAEALASLGIDLDVVRRRAEESFGPGALEATRAWRRATRLRLTPRTKKVLQIAVEQAARHGVGFAEPEHILLALARTPESLGCRLLERRGVSASRLHAEVLDRIRRSA